MKKLLWIFAGVLLFSNLILTTGCTDDEDDPSTSLAPIVSITEGPTPDAFVGSGIVTVKVEALKGTKALKSLTVYEGTAKVGLDDLSINGSPASANPALIVSPSDQMTWVVAINVSGASGIVTYTIEVADEGGKSDEVSFDVTLETPIEKLITGATILLWNQAGPSGRGGIDLDDGSSTGTKLSSTGEDSYLRAELRDMGIDSLAGSGNNWRRRIGGINGTQVRFVGNADSGSDIFDFDRVLSKEGIKTAFDAAADLPPANTISEGHIDVWGNFRVSNKVAKGDIFVVYKSASNVYYLVKVEDVNETTALGDNEDNYKVSIKY